MHRCDFEIVADGHLVADSCDVDVHRAQAGARLPIPEFIHQLGAEGLRAVYIGDSEVDLQTAQNAALPCISVSWGFRDRSVLEQAGAACICDTVDALYQAICNG